MALEKPMMKQRQKEYIARNIAGAFIRRWSAIRRNKMKKTQIILTFIFCLFTFNCYASQNVRVAILQDASSLSMKIAGPFLVKDLKDGRIIYRGKGINTTVTTYKNVIIMGGIKPDSGSLLVETEGDEDIIIDGRPFRGSIQFIRKADNELLAINHIGLEDYVKGILYHEASHYWPMEALKAQAIVSRTYVIYQIEQSKQRDFDVTNDVYSQVYGGQWSERYRTNKAVDETKSKVLFYKGKVIPAYFHATCGGHTENAAELWGINIPPLQGVVCGFCKESPHFNWHYDCALKEIEEKLKDTSFKVNKIINIIAGDKDRSGRILTLKIISKDKEVSIPAKDFRSIIGSNNIKSTNFSVAIAGHDAVFEGVGWGHGVGLCQWGAYFMAKQGASVEKILKYYYPGADIETFRF